MLERDGPVTNPLIALAEGMREAGGEVTEVDMVVKAYEPSVATLTVDMADMMKQARVFHVKEPKLSSPVGFETRPQTIMAFSIRPLEDAWIEHFAAEGQRVLEWAKRLEITDNASARTVAGDLRAIAALGHGVMERSKELMAPIMGVVADMKKDLATIALPLAEADKLGRQKVSAWDTLQRQIAADAREATRLAGESAEAAARVVAAGGQAPDISAITEIEVPAERGPIRPDSGGTVSMVNHYSAEIENEDLIPREWMTPNMQKLNLEARQRKGGKAIPGVRWVNKPSPSVR